jgi:signal transduction histidine kinase
VAAAPLRVGAGGLATESVRAEDIRAQDVVLARLAAVQVGLRWKRRLLVAAVVLVECAILWAIHGLLETTRVTVSEFTMLQSETLETGGELRRLLAEAEMAGGTGSDALARARERLEARLEQEGQLATSAAGRRVVERVRRDARDHLDSMARQATRAPAPGAQGRESAELAVSASRLHRGFDEVAGLRGERLRLAVREHLARVQSLRYLELALFALLIPATAFVAWRAYRTWLRPLRAELVESRRLLEQQEKLAALGTLAAGVAHEINNPLTAIKARLYSLRKHVASLAPASHDLEVVSGEIDRLQRIVRSMLSYARPPQPQLAPVALDAIAREVLDLVGGDCDARRAHLVMRAEQPVSASADAEQLRQIVLNLVRNAVDALEGSGGTVVVAVSAGEVFPSGRRAPHAVLTVADDGPGISADDQARLFDPFFTTKKSGTGLGLSIVQRLVQNHAGEISFWSRAGAGTQFEVHLPPPADAPAVAP